VPRPGLAGGVGGLGGQSGDVEAVPEGAGEQAAEQGDADRAADLAHGHQESGASPIAMRAWGDPQPARSRGRALRAPFMAAKSERPKPKPVRESHSATRVTLKS
jgi:hypothetical protein